jgi:hypothetical protein
VHLQAQYCVLNSALFFSMLGYDDDRLTFVVRSNLIKSNLLIHLDRHHGFSIDFSCLSNLVSSTCISSSACDFVFIFAIRSTCGSCWYVYVIDRPFFVSTHVCNPFTKVHLALGNQRSFSSWNDSMMSHMVE